MASQATGARQDVLVSDLDVPRPPVDSKIDSLTVSTTGSSASAAFARSLFLFLGRSCFVMAVEPARVQSRTE